jgi:hypothetical protein
LIGLIYLNVGVLDAAEAEREPAAEGTTTDTTAGEAGFIGGG